MEVRSVENAKILECDVLVVNKFENKLTSNDMLNEFLPEDFTGKAGEIFVLHTHKKAPSTYILAVGFGKENELDGNAIRENMVKAIKKCADLKAKTVCIDITTDYMFGTPALIGAYIANYHFDKY